MPPKRRKKRATPATISVPEAVRFAREKLSKPPEKPWVERSEPVGRLVAEFVLPLHLCKPFNRIGRAGEASQGWRLGKDKKDAYRRMWAQNGGKAKAPLPGRPHVHVIRFSSGRVEHDSGWTKSPVDRLLCKENGLGIIQDDKPKLCRVTSWCEPAPRGAGFVYVAVWTGEDVS